MLLVYGYGNYLIETSIQYYPSIELMPGMTEDHVLFFDRVIFTWKGGQADYVQEYGTSIVYSLLDFSDFVAELV